MANKARESTVIQFAIKEKSVIDAKKEKEAVEKQLADAKKEIKNYTTKFQALNEEKSRIAYLMDEKVRKYIFKKLIFNNYNSISFSATK